MPIKNPEGDPASPATYGLLDVIYVRVEQRGEVQFVTGISREEYEASRAEYVGARTLPAEAGPDAVTETLWTTRRPGEGASVVDNDPTMLIIGEADRLRLPNDLVFGKDARREFKIVDQRLAACPCAVGHQSMRHTLEGGVYVVYECGFGGWLVGKVKT